MTADLLKLLQTSLGDRFPILRRIRSGTLTRLPSEFITDDLRQRLADLVWKVKVDESGEAAPSPASSPAGRGGGLSGAAGTVIVKDDRRQGRKERWLYLIVLLEFQSAVDWMMAARVQDYATQIWLDMHRRRPFRSDRAPPPILPVVLYNGETPWNAPTRVVDLCRPARASGERARYGGIEAGPLQFCGDGFVLLDLQALEDSELPDDNGVAWLARVESVDDEEALFAMLGGVIGWLEDTGDATLGATVLGWMGALNEVSGLAKSGEFEMAMQAAVEGRKRLKGHWTERVYQDRLRRMARERAEGRDEGEALGLERERSLLSRQVGRRFGSDAAVRMAPLLDRADHDGLVQIGDWIVDCRDAGELLRRCVATVARSERAVSGSADSAETER